jgi:endonuclease YncB( thermonuclease family)
MRNFSPMGQAQAAFTALSWMLVAALLVLSANAAQAVDDMPPPKSAPRTKVQQERLTVEESRGNRTLTGTGRVVDAERIKVGDTELRLFGIVLPQKNATGGTEARAALEKLLDNSTLKCRIQDRDKGFRILGSCGSDAHPDLALNLLQQGWAVVARGTVQQSEFGDLYQAAEKKAQLQKLGIWAENGAKAGEPESATTTKDETEKSTTPVPATTPAANAQPAEPAIAVAPEPTATTVSSTPPAPPASAQPSTAVSAPTSPTVITQNLIVPPELLWFTALVPAGLILLLVAGRLALKRYEYQQERRALAAALRGELMAARAICLSRADSLGYGLDEAQKLSTLWPRLRSSVYQAYVGRIGLLGPDLARRIASLYGQFSDYSQFYAARASNEQAARIDAAAVQTTLNTIIDHIEETMSNLQKVEQSGIDLKRFASSRTAIDGRGNRQLVEKATHRKHNYIDAEISETSAALTQPAAAAAAALPVLSRPDENPAADLPLSAQAVAVVPSESQPPAEQETAAVAELEKPEKSASKSAPAFVEQKPTETLPTLMAAASALSHNSQALVALTETHKVLLQAEKPQSVDSAEILSEKTAAPAFVDIGDDFPDAVQKPEELTALAVEPKPKSATAEAASDSATESADSDRDDYYDFRSQAIKIAQ